jgi:hypothetical protein
MSNIPDVRDLIIAIRRGTPKFEMPKVEAVAACYAKPLEALAFSLAVFIKEITF